ncbi:MAG: type II secretion system F family protein [Candidatus Dormibacteria bacterium]
MIYLFAALAAAGMGVVYWSFLPPAPAPASDGDSWIPATEEVDAPPRPTLTLQQAILAPLSGLARPFLSSEKDVKLQDELLRAGLNLRAQEFLVAQGVSAVTVAIVDFARFRSVLLVVPGLLVGYFLPVIYMRRRQAKLKRAYEDQLADVIQLMTNGLKAGYSIQQAFQSVVDSGREPLASEVGRIVRETTLGITLETALQHANDRIKSKDFDLMVTAILIHRAVGGNLAEVLGKITETIRERVQVHGEVRVLTAQARASGYIITALPFAVAGILSLISPGFEKPLFTTGPGIVLIVVGMVTISIGYALIQKITDIHL